MSKSSIYGISYMPSNKEETVEEPTKRDLKEQSTRNQRVRHLGQLLKEAHTENARLKRQLREAEDRLSQQKATEAELARLRRILGRR